MGVPGLIPGLGRSPGESNGNPLQYSCLENPTDRGAWRATVHGVTKSQTQLSNLPLHPSDNVYSWSLNNAGLNCAGPLVHWYTAHGWLNPGVRRKYRYGGARLTVSYIWINPYNNPHTCSRVNYVLTILVTVQMSQLSWNIEKWQWARLQPFSALTLLSAL